MIALKIIGGLAVLLVAGLLIYAATRPDSFRIERSAVMGVFFNMERMVGGQFELGLANLKAVSEN